ncbi:MAG: hypothetical protein WC304_00230, partial [Candidatus Gracilibacteria bacterium]
MQILEKFQIKCQNSILKVSGSGANLLMNQPEAQDNHDSHAAPHGEAAHDSHDSHGGHGHHHPAAAFVPENLGTYIVEGPHHSPFDVETFEKCLNELFRQAGKKNTFLSLEIATIHQKTGFYFTCVKEFAEKFQAVIYAFFPAAEISPAEHFPPHLGENTEFAGGEI